MDPISLSSTLSFLLAISISNKRLFLGRRKCLKPSFTAFHWNSAKPWLENPCEGQRVVSERITTDVGQGLSSFVWELEDAAVWRGYLVIQFHIAVVVHRNALIVAGGSLCTELTAGSSLYRALGVMMFKTCEYKITLSSSSISWKGRKKPDRRKNTLLCPSSLPQSLIMPSDVEPCLTWLLGRYHLAHSRMDVFLGYWYYDLVYLVGSVHNFNFQCNYRIAHVLWQNSGQVWWKEARTDFNQMKALHFWLN